MRRAKSWLIFVCLYLSLLLASSYAAANQHKLSPPAPYDPRVFEARMPHYIQPLGEKVVIVNPHLHAWAAYNPDGNVVRGGLATSGSDWCRDLGRPCHTRTGSFRVLSLGSANCKSTKFPLPNGGAPMPFCMFFNHGQALHGVSENEVKDANLSHGCVRLHVEDAAWLRFNFVNVGTRVIVLPY